MTRILCIADEPDRGLWDFFSPAKVAGIDLILSAGDLSASYLEFLVTMANVPLLYVPGNHDTRYAVRPPEGCECVDGQVVDVCGLRIAGLGGSLRYRPGIVAYTEDEMRRRARRMEPRVALRGGVDILLTHAPAAGVGDLDDPVHRGFACFGELCERWGVRYLVHGHVHRSYTAAFVREREMACGTVAVNAYGRHVLDVEPAEREPIGHGAAWFLDLYERMVR